MRLSSLTPACALILAVPAYAQSDQVSTALRYVQAQEAVMEVDAGKTHVDALIDFYTEDYTYYHPQVGAKVSVKADGIDTMRRGISSHLGETSDAQIEVRGVQTIGDLVSLSIVTNYTLAANGQKVVRPGLMILTVRSGKITQRMDITDR